MHYTPRVAPGFWSLGLELNTPITLSIIRFWNVLQTKSELWVSVKVYPTKTMLPGEYISLTWGVLVFYLKILIGHPWNQSWGGFSSAEATSEVAQEVGKGERESDNLEERIQYFLKVLKGDEILTTNTSHFNLREKIAVKKKRIQKAGAATRPAQNIDTLQYIESRIWGVKNDTSVVESLCWSSFALLSKTQVDSPSSLI